MNNGIVERKKLMFSKYYKTTNHLRQINILKETDIIRWRE